MADTEWFFLVWGAGRFDSTVKHASMADAKREAERLALARPGTRFYVLKAEGFAVHEAAKWTDLPDNPEIPF